MKTRLLVLAACALSAGYLPAAPAEDPAIAKVRASYAAAVNAGDPAKLASLFAETGVEMPPNHELVKGRAAIKAYHEQLNATGDARITITPMETTSSGSIGFDAGTYKQTIKLKSGQTVEDKGKYLVVLEKGTGGEWQVSYAAYNSDLPPAPAQGQK